MYIFINVIVQWRIWHFIKDGKILFILFCPVTFKSIGDGGGHLSPEICVGNLAYSLVHFGTEYVCKQVYASVPHCVAGGAMFLSS